MYFITLIVGESIIRKQEYRKDENIKVIRWAALSGLLFFFGLRGFIGWDWYNYYPAFNSVPKLFSPNGELFTATDYNSGFVIYISFLKSIWNNYHFLIFISTLIDLIILNVVIKRYSKYSYAFAILLFIVMGGFYLETDLIRNSKGIMLFLLSLKYVKERKLLPFLLLNIAGSMFHLSSILYLPLYFFLTKKIKKEIVIGIFITGLIITLIQLEYIRPFLTWITNLLGEKFVYLLEKYLELSNYSTGYGLTIGLLERLLTSSLIIIYYDKLTDSNDYNRIFINSFIVYFIIFFFFSEIKIIPIRVGGLFSFSYWILYPALLEVISNRNNRRLIIVFFMLYALIKIAGMTDNILYRYVNTLLGKDNYIERLEVFDKAHSTLFK